MAKKVTQGIFKILSLGWGMGFFLGCMDERHVAPLYVCVPRVK